jgi:RNA polymerase sigma-70 factor (ECF subfamily)
MMARVGAGDDSALATIYDQYSPLVYGMACRLVGRVTAADVTQHVFLQLWEHPDRFDGERGSLRTYLATIARRRSIDVVRSATRSARRETVVAAERAPAVPNVDEAVVALIASERVRSAVAALPEDQRQAVELAYYEGLTYREVAAALGIPEGTAKSRLRLALAKLSVQLHGEGTETTP